EAFCRRHSRYTRANAALVAHAFIAPGMHLLDLAAGTGRTAQAALRRLGDEGSIVCVEPALGMRTEGMRRLTDSRVQWSCSVPDATGSFDRILCGAAIWQLEPLCETIHALAGLLRPGGALCFNIPATYLLEPEDPGGGSDPALVSLPALLSALSEDPPTADVRDHWTPAPLSASAIDTWLHAAGLEAASWSFRVRMTQHAYADWLKIPAVTHRLLGALTPHARARHIDAALSSVDRSSWKCERWRG